MKEQRLDCPYDFTSRCTMGRCDCKPKEELPIVNGSYGCVVETKKQEVNKMKQLAEQTAVEWLYENLLINPMSDVDIVYNERVLKQAKEMEKVNSKITIIK